MATRTMIFFIYLYVLKPWLTFVREHGNSERILDALLVVKLFKHIINLNTQKGFKGLWFYECSLPESDARASFSYIYIYFLGAGLLMSFHGLSCPSIMITCILPQTWGASGCGNGESRFLLFNFLSNWDGAPWELVPYANCVLCL